MSLRYQISLRIFLISLGILMLGGGIAIWQARNAVSNEVDSSIKLALQLIKISVGTTQSNEVDWVYRLSTLEQTRHLKIQLKKPSGSIINITHSSPSNEQQENPPGWFVNLVVSDYPKAEHQITTFDNRLLTLIIQANPMDEMIEVWHETIAFFTTLLLLVLLTFLSVHLAFNKTLQDIQTIIDNLRGVERGEYHNKLPNFSTLEYNSIAKAINHMNDVLNSTQQQYQALTQHSLKIQEEERQHLSQELHDEFGQSLTAIKVMAVTVAHEGADTKTVTSSIIEICDHLMTVLRSMMKQLHPLILTELGLKATLEDLINHWEARARATTFNLQVDDAVDKLDKTIIIQVFRVIQESLTNIIRHAKATQVIIRLSINPESNTLDIFVNDNGQGCDLNSVSTGFGLQGMAERVKLLGGSFKLHSQPGKGMEIKAQVPIV
ncbi:MAG: sensor histidine kinase [Thiotrichaceae bacterium]|nr:sensor histidine kinase [Thiotrichaceae bacterium]